MGTDLSAAQQTVVAVNPATGEAIDLHNDATDILASERRGVTDLRDALQRYANELDAELTNRLDKANTRSAEVGGFRIETKAPTTTTFDPKTLGPAIDSLVAAGHLEESVIEKVLIPQPAKVSRTEVNKLLKHANPDVRKAIEAVAVEEDQRRTVQVKPL